MSSNGSGLDAANTPSQPQAVPAPAAISQVAPDRAGITICLAAFNDVNKNAAHESGESLTSNVAFTISDGQNVVTNYVTDGVSEPFCVKGIDPGTFRISRSIGVDEVLTTAGDHSVSLTEGSSITLEFGSYQGDPSIAMAGRSGAGSNSLENRIAVDSADGDGSSGLLVAAVVVAVLLTIGVLVIILTTRRSAI